MEDANSETRMLADEAADSLSRPAANKSGWAPIFSSVLLFVGLVSAYDGYLVVRTGESIQEFEKNPVGRYLIDINDGNPSIFLRVKAAGTLVVLSALSFLHHYSHRIANPVAFALFVFQSGLLIYLEHT